MPGLLAFSVVGLEDDRDSICEECPVRTFGGRRRPRVTVATPGFNHAVRYI